MHHARAASTCIQHWHLLAYLVLCYVTEHGWQAWHGERAAAVAPPAVPDSASTSMQEADTVNTATREHIVADGQQRLQAQLDYDQKAQEFLAVVTKQYAAELAQANLLQRYLIRRKIWREVRQKLEDLAPNHGLYLKADV